MSDSITEADERNATYMDIANQRFVAALTNGIGPIAFAWRDPGNGSQWTPSEEARAYRTQGYMRALRSTEAKEAALARAVSRDPCPYCATRADVGCRHRRIA